MTPDLYVKRTVRMPPANLAEAEEPRFFLAVRCICRYHSLRVCKRELRVREADAMLILIDYVLCRIPLEVHLRHIEMLH